MKSLTIAPALLLAASLAVAQSPQTGTKQPDAKTKPAEKPPAAAKTSEQTVEAKPVAPRAPAAGDMPRPTPEMERVTRMLRGLWQTDEKHEPSPMMPQGGTGKGQEYIRLGPGGLSLIAEYGSRSPMGEFSGIGLMTWNAATGVYNIHWTDNTSPTVTMMTGKWVGPDLVFTGSEMMMGKKILARHAFTQITDSGFTYTIDTGPAVNQLKRAVTISYTRADRNPRGRAQ
jgi:hypothetical protein